MSDTSIERDFSLRPMLMEDMQTVYDWRRQPHIARFMFSDDAITLDGHKHWFEQTLSDNSVDYRILEWRGKAIGLANATNIHEGSKQCYWGFYIGDKAPPNGAGTIMGEMMLKHIFDRHPVSTVIGEAFAFNTASLKLHHKLGFREVPELNRTVIKQGKPEQVIVLQLHANDRHQ